MPSWPSEAISTGMARWPVPTVWMASDKGGRVPVFRADADFEMLTINTYVANIYIVRGVAGEGRTGSEIAIFWFRLAQGDVYPAVGDARENVRTDGRVGVAARVAFQRVSTNGRVFAAVTCRFAAKRASTDGCVVLALVLEAIARSISQARVMGSVYSDVESGIVKERLKADGPCCGCRTFHYTAP